MKKMITAVSILAVAAGLVMASAGAISKVKKSDMVALSMLPAINDQDMSVPSTRDITGWTSSASTGYAGHFFGNGWYIGPQKKIAFDPTTGLIGSAFRMADSENGSDLTGTIGGMATRSDGLNDGWKDWIDAQPLSRTSTTAGTKFTGRYPSITACEGYLFGLYNNYTPDGGNSSAVISVYSKADESWSERINITDGTNLPPDAWSPMGDVVKDAEGYYHMLISYELTLNNKDFCVITGKTKTPMVANSWVWTNYNDFKFGEKLNGMTNCFLTNVAWGQNGFGIVVTSGGRATDTHNQIMYAYTKNYGQSWEKNIADVSGVKLFDVPEPCEFLGMADTVQKATETSISQFYFPSFDVTVGLNNSIHIAGRVYRGIPKDPQHYWGGQGYCSSNNFPINGIMYVRGDFTGNAINWQTGRVVAEAIGGRDTDVEAPETAPVDVKQNYLMMGQASVHVGTADGMVYIGYLDRPANAKHVTEFPIIVPSDKTRAAWFSDGFMIYNDGTQWHYGDAITKRGFNVTNTPNIHEQGFSVSRKGKKHSASSVELYAGYQVWQPDMPLYTGQSPDDVSSFQQKYFAMQINASQVGIEASAVNMNKNFALEQNYPNPFNPTTAIAFNLNSASDVKLTVFNVRGEVVSNLINARMVQGAHTANFNAANLNSGVYFYKLTVDGQSAVKKMVLTK